MFPQAAQPILAAMFLVLPLGSIMPCMATLVALPCEEWAHQIHSPSVARVVLVSPDGQTIYAAGSIQNQIDPGTYDGLVLAMDGETGRPLWERRVNPPAVGSLALVAGERTSDGRVLFLAGGAADLGGNLFRTVAIDPADGDVLWSAIHEGGAPGGVEVGALALSADESLVFAGGGDQVIAYHASSGEEVWSARYPRSPLGPWPAVRDLLARTDALYVLLDDYPTPTGERLLTLLRHDPGTGATQLIARFGDSTHRAGHSFTLEWAKGKILVGANIVWPDFERMTVVAFNEETGDVAWATPLGPGVNLPVMVTVNSDGTLAYLAGTIHVENAYGGQVTDIAIAGLRPDDGTVLWNSLLPPLTFGARAAHAVTVSGETAYITGYVGDLVSGYLTIAVDEYGRTEWLAVYSEDPLSSVYGGYARALAADPAGHRIFVSGEAEDAEQNGEYGIATVAYDA